MSDASLGQIVGAVVGGVIGFIAGGPWGAIQGASIGYGLGTAIDPPPGPVIKTPRLDDRSFQSDIYGSPNFKLYGTISRICPVMWLENGELKIVTTYEEQEGGKGGGGGAEVEKHTYYATFAVSVGEVLPGAVVRKIWVGGELWYNGAAKESGLTNTDRIRSTVVSWSKTTETNGSFNFYDGTQTNPDSRMEAQFGIGNTPNYQGDSYLVIKDLELTNFGNTLAGATIKVEIAELTSVEPEIIMSKEITAGGLGDNFEPVTRKLSVSDMKAYCPNWRNAYPATSTYDAVQHRLNGSSKALINLPWAPEGGTTFVQAGLTHDEYHYLDARAMPGHPDITYSGSGASFMYRRNKFFGIIIYGGTNNGPRFVTAGPKQIIGWGVEKIWDMGTRYNVGLRALAIDEYGTMYGVAETYIYKWNDNFDEIEEPLAHTFGTFNSTAFEATDMYVSDGVIYLLNKYANPNKLAAYKSDLSEKLWQTTIPHTPGETMAFAVDDGILCRSYFYSSSNNLIVGTDYTEINTLTTGQKSVGDIVTDLLGEVGIVPDVTDISAETTLGYRAEFNSVRGALQQLQVAYMFDIVKDGYGVKCVSRKSKTPSRTIHRDDLAAGSGSDDRVLIESKIEMENQLPWKYNVKYLDPTRDYDSGSQFQTFPTSSKLEKEIELAISMSHDEAVQIADALIHASHTERETFTFSLPHTYSDMEVGEVVTLQGLDKDVIVRITEKSMETDGVVKCAAKKTDPNVYTSTAKGATALPAKSTLSMEAIAGFTLLDIPKLSSAQDSYSLLFSTFPEDGDGWNGAALYQSYDAGLTYNSRASLSSVPIRGIASNSIPTDDGLAIDTSSSLNLFVESGQFASVTEEQLFAGANVAAYGVDGRWEIIQFQTVVTNSDGTVNLSNFIRGRNGTEWATGLHQPQDEVIVLNTSQIGAVSLEANHYGAELFFKAVAFGQSLQNAAEETITYNAVNLKPLSPFIDANQSNDDWVIDITTRTREQTSFWTSGVIPATESGQTIEIDVLDGQGGSVVRTLSTSGTQITYSSADQTTDFGSPANSFYCEVYVLNDIIGRGYPLVTQVA